MNIKEKNNHIKSILSAWTGHIDFAQWLVDYKKPEVVVDLGVDYGVSTYAFALQNIGTVYGIDWFMGDEQTGTRNTELFVKNKLKELEINNTYIVKSTFDDISKIWNRPIDILHIDGYHTYEAVSNDYENWHKHVKEYGVILFHDTCVEGFGVRQFFNEISLPKLNFTNSHGLGMVTKDLTLLNLVKQQFNSLIEPN